MGKDMAWQLMADGGRPTQEPLEKCKIEIVRVSRQLMDPDGLVGCVKPFLDALTTKSSYGAGFIVDDNPECLVDLQVTQRKGLPGMEVKIYGV